MEDPPLGAARRRGCVLNRHDTVPVLDREGGVEHLAEDLEASGADANRDRHGEAADEGEAAVLDEHAQAEPRVERQHVEPPQSPRVASLFLELLQASEREQCLPARLARVEPALAHEAIGLHLDVESHLVVHCAIERASAPQRAPHR